VATVEGAGEAEASEGVGVPFGESAAVATLAGVVLERVERWMIVLENGRDRWRCPPMVLI